jgi:hypothetical protein
MNTYRCPICGKAYTSATAMAACATKCAEKEDRTSRLNEADSNVTLAKEALEAAIDEYNSISKEFDYMVTLSKKAKGGTTKYETAFSEMAKEASTLDLESFLKGACKIDEPKAKRAISADELKLNKEAEEYFNELEQMIRSDSKNDILMKSSLCDLNLIKIIWNGATYKDKRELIVYLREEIADIKKVRVSFK